MLTGTTTPGQSEPGSNGNDGISTLYRSRELEPHHQMQFSVIHRIPCFFEEDSYLSAEDTVSIF